MVRSACESDFFFSIRLLLSLQDALFWFEGKCVDVLGHGTMIIQSRLPRRTSSDMNLGRLCHRHDPVRLRSRYEQTTNGATSLA